MASCEREQIFQSFSIMQKQVSETEPLLYEQTPLKVSETSEEELEDLNTRSSLDNIVLFKTYLDNLMDEFNNKKQKMCDHLHQTRNLG